MHIHAKTKTMDVLPVLYCSIFFIKNNSYLQTKADNALLFDDVSHHIVIECESKETKKQIIVPFLEQSR